MKVQIRRNTSISFSFKMKECDKETIKKLIDNVSPKLTPEQQSALDEGRRQKEEIESNIWEYLSQNPTVDLDGDLITKETHEVVFETETEEIDGLLWGVCKQVYIQPKKSSYI